MASIPIPVVVRDPLFYQDSVKSPVDYILDQPDGQQIKTWFKDEFGAKKTIELAPKLKSSRGFAKAKIVVDPSDKTNINISEELEIQTSIESKAAQFKIKPTELSGLFDLGLVQTGDHLLNPYFGVKFPRFGTNSTSQSTTTLGFLFHLARTTQSRFRFQTEFNFKVDPKKDRTQVEAKTHARFAYSYFVLSVLKTFNLTETAPVASKVSVAGTYRDASGYAQVDLTHVTPTLLTVGAGYRVHKKVALYAQGVQALQKAEKEEKLASPSVTFGVDYAHCTGFGGKAAIDLKGKLQTAVNFTANKYFSGSLLFDTNVCKVAEGQKRDIAWGAKLKFNC